jgi:predicted dehydrogenase
MWRMAIVGVGWAGTRQIEAVRELGRKVAVECLVDSDTAHLRAKADEFGIAKTCTTLADALADPDINAVSICLPHDLHEPAAAAAAAAGKQILCEKPPSRRRRTLVTTRPRPSSSASYRAPPAHGSGRGRAD